MSSGLSRCLVTVVFTSACSSQPSAPAPLELGQFGKYDDPRCVRVVQETFRKKGIRDNLVALWRAKHYAYGDKDNLVSFEWRLHGTSHDVLRYYRPKGMHNSTWDKMTMAERIHHHKTIDKGLWWRYVRYDAAPEFLTPTLKTANNGRSWVLRPGKEVDTLDELFTQASLGNQIDIGGQFVWDVKYVLGNKHARLVSEFLATGNEFSTAKYFATDAANVKKLTLGPLGSDDFEAVYWMIKANEFDELPGAASTFAVKLPPLDKAGRSGFVVHTESYDLNTARSMLANIVRFVDDPKNAVIKFGSEGKGYTISDMRRVSEHLHGTVVDRLGVKTQHFLKELEHTLDIQVSGPPLLDRWGYPFVRWDKRPGISDSAKQLIKSAQDEYQQQLDRLAATYARLGREPDAHARDLIEHYMHQFFARTHVFKYM